MQRCRIKYEFESEEKKIVGNIELEKLTKLMKYSIKLTKHLMQSSTLHWKQKYCVSEPIKLVEREDQHKRMRWIDIINRNIS